MNAAHHGLLMVLEVGSATTGNVKNVKCTAVDVAFIKNNYEKSGVPFKGNPRATVSKSMLRKWFRSRNLDIHILNFHPKTL